MRRREISKKDSRIVHGHISNGVKTPEYTCWSSMKRRCYKEGCKAFKHYGARGIKICDRWMEKGNGFLNFLSDMGEKPAPKNRYSLERIDNDGNYEPSNCKWATWEEQAVNKRPHSDIVDKIKKICDYCGNGFEVFPCDADHRFCKRRCYLTYISISKPTRKCLVCNGTYFIRPRMSKTSKYCSRQCYNKRPSAKIKSECAKCGVPICYFPYMSGIKKYCSTKCSGVFEKTKIIKDCLCCGREMRVKKTQIDKRKYCNMVCRKNHTKQKRSSRERIYG